MDPNILSRSCLVDPGLAQADPQVGEVVATVREASDEEVDGARHQHKAYNGHLY